MMPVLTHRFCGRGVLRDDGLLPDTFVFPSLTQKAADKNRRSQKPPAGWICARTFGKWTKDTKAVILPELVLITGLIPYFKMGKAVRFRVADVAAAIERMRVR